MTDVSDIVNAVSGKRYRYRGEIDLHVALSAALDMADIEHRREVVVPGGRIDFVVDRIGIEVKIKGTAVSLQRQIAKYALAEELDEFLVITTRPLHRTVTGTTTGGKRVRVVTIGGMSL